MIARRFVLTGQLKQRASKHLFGCLQVSYTDMLEVTVWDADKFSGDDKIGMLEIKVADIAAEPRVRHGTVLSSCQQSPLKLLHLAQVHLLVAHVVCPGLA